MLDGLPSIYKALGLIPQCCKTNQLTRKESNFCYLNYYLLYSFNISDTFRFFPHKSIFFLGRHDGTRLQFKHLGVWDSHKFKASQILFNSPFCFFGLLCSLVISSSCCYLNSDHGHSTTCLSLIYSLSFFLNFWNECLGYMKPCF